MKCHICNKDIYIRYNGGEPKKIDGKPTCEDCYYDELGKVIEEHPIGFQFYKDHDNKSNK